MIDLEVLRSIAVQNQKAMIVLCVFIVLDIVTGVLKAASKKELVSSKFRQGCVKKIFELVLIIVGFCLDYLTDLSYVGNTVSVFFIVMEGYSILENTSEFVELPGILKAILEGLQGDKDKDDI